MLKKRGKFRLTRSTRIRVKELTQVNESWLKAGVWGIEDKDGNIRTLKGKKAPTQYGPVPGQRICENDRDTAIHSIKLAGRPGSEARVNALRKAYHDGSLSEDESPFECDMGKVLAPYVNIYRDRLSIIDTDTKGFSNDKAFQQKANGIEGLTNGSKRVG
jgi:hypothetical protein